MIYLPNTINALFPLHLAEVLQERMNRFVSSHHISALPALREIKTAWI